MFGNKVNLFYEADGGASSGGGTASASPASGGSDNGGSNNVGSTGSEQQTSGADNAQQQQVGDTSDKSSVYSKGGSFKMTVDEYGRPKVVRNLPNTADEGSNGGEQAKADGEQQKQDNSAVLPGNEQLAGLVTNTVAPAQPKEYTPNEFVVAMQLGQVDEERIPEVYRNQYQAYKQKAQQHQAGPTAEQNKADEAEQALANAEYYAKINALSENLALKELGITKEDLDMAEYTDDETIRQKADAYKVAVEAKRNQILADIAAEAQKSAAIQNEHKAAMAEVKNFYNQVSKQEPNFLEIDKLMVSRVEQMPFAEAVKIKPLIDNLRKGTITRAELPQLQKYYEDTRITIKPSLWDKIKNLKLIRTLSKEKKKGPKRYLKSQTESNKISVSLSVWIYICLSICLFSDNIVEVVNEF